MKILELRFKNLNSLYGEWAIDFTSPQYAANGIFALTGPTGAGKSTILDAICLALYGATPRLGRITKSGNEIMSRQTGECFAEVVFESQAGRFRCQWRQHRARKKADGHLAEAGHEIADADSGRILESKKRNVAGVIEEKTGMDFERFTRSILLAQGGFDTFLRADAEEKSRILEQITGTEIYTEISKGVHERQRAQRERLTLQEAEIKGLALLGDEEETRIRQRLAEALKAEAQAAQRALAAGKAVEWLRGIDRLQTEISALSDEAEKLNTAWTAFEPQRQRLSRALKAAELDAPFATLTSLRKQMEEDGRSLQDREAEMPGIDSTVRQKAAALQKAEQATAAAAGARKTAAPLIQQVRALDQQLADKANAIDAQAGECRKVEALIAENKKRLNTEKHRLEAVHTDLLQMTQYLQTNARDELLIGGFAVIEEQLKSLLSLQMDLAQTNKALKKAENQSTSAKKTLANRTHEAEGARQALAAARMQLELKKKELNTLLGRRLLREYRTEKETLLREMAFLRQIADLASERARLEDGKPCPLCGATAHPYAEGNVPGSDKTEKKISSLTRTIEAAEQLEADIKGLDDSEKSAFDHLSAAEKKEAAAANDRKAAESRVQDLAEEADKYAARTAALKQSALARLQPLGIDAIPDSDISDQLASLKERLNNWKERQNCKETTEKQMADLNSALKQREAVIETLNRTRIDQQNALASLKKEYDDQSAQRRRLFAERNPNHEEEQLDKAISQAQENEKSARAARDEAVRAQQSIAVNIAALKERIEKGTRERQILEPSFIRALHGAGFADEAEFEAGRLPVPERHRLSAREKQLDDLKTDLLARKKDREGRLALEIEKKVTEETLETLEPVRRELDEAVKHLRDELAGLKHRLAENQTARETKKEKLALIAAQQTECRRWDNLHALIGSADGKKYRNFAQGLTFERMVAHANRQLEKMSDRYLLIRDDAQPLALNVVDNYQAGEIRSTKNLSGGESFIVSLALALGLSKMASRKVRVDSLFLDEGFGSLDEEALETALDTLAGLHQDNKLIGIISHVPALKERIGVQIGITPVSGGRSIIIGPGCRQITDR